MQILDEGRLIDSEGNYIDFKNTILILTSNIGSEEIINIVNKEERNKKIEKKINSFFKPEFLNRLDDIIYFNKLDKKDIKLIIKNQLSILQNRLNQLSFGYSRKKVGTLQTCLVYGQSKRDPGQLQARTICNRIVNFSSCDIDLIGQMVNIQINEALPNSLRGTLSN